MMIMFPPTQNPNVDARAISGITGSISIACWVIVFSPQIIINFRRGSAEGLSLTFLVVWLAGDVFNVLGAVLQGVLPTMVILAVYYTLADIVLLGQCLYYKYKTRHELPAPATTSHAHEHIPDATHLSPATPLLDPPKSTDEALTTAAMGGNWGLCATILFNTFAVLMVCLAGVVGWWLTPPSPSSTVPDGPKITFDLLGQIFGYFCAVLYLASRVPQIYLNYQRQTVEGLSLLFFLFACLGNLTYVLSIISYVPQDVDDGKWTAEGKQEYWRYIAVNASWLLGSVGTLFLDMIIFVQFFWYRDMRQGYEYETISNEGSVEEDDYHY